MAYKLAHNEILHLIYDIPNRNFSAFPVTQKLVYFVLLQCIGYHRVFQVAMFCRLKKNKNKQSTKQKQKNKNSTKEIQSDINLFWNLSKPIPEKIWRHVLIRHYLQSFYINIDVLLKLVNHTAAYTEPMLICRKGGLVRQVSLYHILVINRTKES